MRNYETVIGALQHVQVRDASGGPTCRDPDHDPNAYTVDGGYVVNTCSGFASAPLLPQTGATELSKTGIVLHEAFHMLASTNFRDQSNKACSGSSIDSQTHLPKCYGAANAHALRGAAVNQALINPDNYAFFAEDLYRP